MESEKSFYVFRLQSSSKSGALKNNSQGWFISKAYEDREISDIPDPEGGMGGEPTSIPSPFARMDLVRTAFKFVNESNDLDGITIFHKIVSDCMDLAQIMSNYDLYKVKNEKIKIRILQWDRTIEDNPNKKGDLYQLLVSTKEHKNLGESLKLFLEQDARAFNFERMNSIHLIQYGDKIIGGTSPITLFFTTANRIENVDITFPQGDKAFDKNFRPLYKRDPEFIKYLVSMRAHMEKKVFAGFFREFSTYLDKNLNVLPEDHKTSLTDNEFEPGFYSKHYDKIENGIYILKYAVQGNETSLPLLKTRPVEISSESGKSKEIYSDFRIQSEKRHENEILPLILFNDFKGRTSDGRKLIYYANTYYDEKIKIPYHSTIDEVFKRELPGITGVKYPWLTVSDFLEPFLIQLPYSLNSEKFFDGNLRIEAGEKKGYILPLKKLFFEYFTIDQLRGTTRDGKKTIEIIQSTGGDVTVILRIPIQNDEYISFERKYRSLIQHTNKKPDTSNNIGIVVENQVSVSLFPFVKTHTSVDSYYRILLIDNDSSKLNPVNSFNLQFYQQDGVKLISNDTKERRNKLIGDLASSKYYSLKDQFDLIQISSGISQGFVIPLWNPLPLGALKFKVAIDFGTSNTHIEYLDPDDGNLRPLEITNKDIQLANLFSDDTIFTKFPAIQKYILHDFLPSLIQSGSDYKFPHRTVICNTIKEFGENEKLITLADLNIPFAFEKEEIVNSTVSTNLKWSTEKGNEERVKAFFEELIFLIRNKILLNKGSLDKTEIVCFFPASMLSGRRYQMIDAWKNLVNGNEAVERRPYISSKAKLTFLSESIAPYYYFSTKGGVSSEDRPVVSIDIGGGTSDIAVYLKGELKFITSFRFAAEAIFGDSFNCSPFNNGFVKKYYRGLDNKSGYSKEIEKVENLDTLFQKDPVNSHDTISFLFSLEKNSSLVKKSKHISLFDDLSKDADLKILFLLFYSSIIYHIGKLLKQSGLEPPKTILLSGNGSRVLNIAEGVSGFNRLEILAKAFFKEIYGVDRSIEIKQHETPKEITCKGGLQFDEKNFLKVYNRGKTKEESMEDIGRIMDSLKIILLGDSTGTIIDKTNFNNLTYKDLNPAIYSNVLKEIQLFNDTFWNVYKNLRLTNEFLIPEMVKKLTFDLMKNESQLLEDLREGVAKKLREIDENIDEPLDETLFFYPFVGLLNKLAYRIVTGH